MCAAYQDIEQLFKDSGERFFGDLEMDELELEHALEAMVINDAMRNNISNPLSKAGDAVWERSLQVEPVQGPYFEAEQSNAQPAAKMRDGFDELATLDYLLQEKYQTIRHALHSLRMPSVPESEVRRSLDMGRDAVEEYKERALKIACKSVEDATLQVELVERCNEIIAEVQRATSIIEKRGDIVSGTSIEFDNGRYLDSGLDKKDPITLFAAFVVIALYTFGSLTREWANAALRLQLELLKVVYGRLRPNGATRYDQDTMDAFPCDIRTASKVFDLEPVTVTFAACPKCSCLYRVLRDRALPVRCTYRRFPTKVACNTVISKLGLREGKERQNSRVPIRPFVMQDFDAFKASLVSRPGMERLLDRGTAFNDSHDMWDIKDGTTVRSLDGPDGKVFLDGLERSELRLIWSLSIDWFNPYWNKIAGPTASSGSIVMSCLNLPPSLRYKSENLFLVGIVPGPHEPSVEEFEHFLNPLVEILEKSWKQGTRYSHTECAPGGRTERSMLAVIVTDLVASRKVTGTASHSSNDFFCSLCTLPKEQIANFNVASWPRRTREEQKKAAENWRDAGSKKAQRQIFKKNGIRWSPLWKLDYYDPAKMVVVDAMHNIYLGIIQFHVRQILGIEAPQPSPVEVKPVSEKEKAAAKCALDDGNISGLRRARVPTLEELCKERRLDLECEPGVKRNKAHLIEKLLQSVFSTKVPSSALTNAHSATRQGDEEDELIECVGIEYVEECQATETFIDTVTKAELERLRKCIGTIIRPQYRRGVPSNLGDPKHGKIKAAQWKAGIEFDLPVAIALIWSKEMQAEVNGFNQRRDKLFRCFMNLAVAVRWGTSYRTSRMHAEKFQHYFQKYLNGLIELYPDISLRPNHHAALHIPQLLLQFGPVHGWWMFPFERVIGNLQKVNTNNKVGELEATMLKSFCASSRLKALLQSENCPQVLQNALTTLQPKWDHETIKDPLLPAGMEITKFARTTNGTLQDRGSEDAFRSAFRAISIDLGEWREEMNVQSHKRISVGGVTFARAVDSERDAHISFCPFDENRWVPGVIEVIYSMELSGKEAFVLGIWPRKPLMPAAQVPDPFKQFEEFGAEIWSNEVDSVTYVPLVKPIYHVQSAVWTEKTLVLKPIKPDF